MTPVIFVLLALQSAAFVQDDSKNRPVSKVITLLNDMVAQLEKEAKEDSDVNDEMTCWCETNDKAKTTAIADGESTIAELTAAIQSYTAQSAKLNTEIENLESEVAANSDALSKATAVREKELAGFNAEEKSSLSTIASLKGAVGALAKHHDAAFLQSESAQETMDYITVVSNLKHALHKESNVIARMLTKKERQTVYAFVQSPDDFLDTGLNAQKPKSALLQAAPSAEIFGVLKQMKEGFETNLAASQSEEMNAQAEYEGVKAGKEKEMAAGQAQIDTKTGVLADTDMKNAESKKMLAETRATLAADTSYLANLKEQCAIFAKEYAERTATRQLETTAVSKALAFLSSDEAQDLVSRTFSFIQQRSESKSAHRRNKVVDALSRVALQFKDPRISTLAIQARLDAFTKVKASIDDMISTLAKEQEEEVQFKDFCVDEITKNEKETQVKEQKKGALEEKIGDLTEYIDKMDKLIKELQAKIADLQIQLKRAGEDREMANSLFQTTVADQRATQKLLEGALNILKGFYEKASLVQTHKKASKQEPAGPPPPPGLHVPHRDNSVSGGVMGMIQLIIDDAKAMEGDAVKAEESAQIAYESFVTETNAAIDTATKESITAAENKAKAEGEKSETEQARDGVVSEIMALIGENGDLHKSCDYTLKNFDLRQAGRQSEMEALKQALSILSGASFSAFLQHH